MSVGKSFSIIWHTNHGWKTIVWRGMFFFLFVYHLHSQGCVQRLDLFSVNTEQTGSGPRGDIR